MITSRDYAKAREVSELRANAKSYDAQKVREAHAAVLAANPEIGKLIRSGKPVYYIMRNGLPVEARDPSELLNGGA